MDPERQWISRLESERPEPPEQIPDETPLGRMREVVAGTGVLAGGVLGLAGIFAEDLEYLRWVAIGVLAVVAAALAWLSRR